jgi:putative ABC transport system ATP-binding protein
MSGLVEIEGLTKTYIEAGRERTVLHDLTVEFQRGEIDAIRGRSGSGKTTLLNLIAGIDEPTAGLIRVNGAELSQMSPEDRARHRRSSIGFIFQFFNLIPTLTVLENVSLPAELSGKSLEQAEDRARSLLEAVGLGDRERDFPDRLSGGEQQRVAIARALAERPDLILADEPTGNLDPATGEQVLTLLEDLVREHQVTLILATHSHQISESADRQFEIEGGRLVEHTGRPEG